MIKIGFEVSNQNYWDFLKNTIKLIGIQKSINFNFFSKIDFNGFCGFF